MATENGAKDLGLDKQAKVCYNNEVNQASIVV